MEKTMNMVLVYETVLCAPGMAETVKLDMRISRKALLLLAAALENTLGQELPAPEALKKYFGDDTREELEKMVIEALVKSDLSGLHSKLKGLESA